MTLSDVGKELGVTGDRIAQIEARALSKLKRANAWLINGKDQVINALQLRHEFEKDVELTTKIQILNQLTDSTTSLKNMIKEAALKTAPDPDEMKVQDLDLPIHTYNRLICGGIGTVTDLRKHTKADIMRIRQFGPKDWENLESKLKLLGIVLPKDDE